MKPGDTRRQNPHEADPMAGRRAWIRVDRAVLTALSEKGDRYRVQIEGHGLKMAIAPPSVSVGGVPATSLRFTGDGATIIAELPHKPAHSRVVVDYGFARDETEAVWETEG